MNNRLRTDNFAYVIAEMRRKADAQEEAIREFNESMETSGAWLAYLVIGLGLAVLAWMVIEGIGVLSH